MLSQLLCEFIFVSMFLRNLVIMLMIHTQRSAQNLHVQTTALAGTTALCRLQNIKPSCGIFSFTIKFKFIHEILRNLVLAND